MYVKQTYVIPIMRRIRCSIFNILYLFGSLAAASVVATMTHLGYVSLLVAFLALLLLKSTVIWRMSASTMIAWSLSLLSSDLVSDTMC